MKGLGKALGFFFAGSFAVIALGLCLKFCLVRYIGEGVYRTPDIQLERHARLLPRKPATDAKVIVIGDSTANFSIDASLLSEAESFALVNSTAIESYYVLKRILDSGARPRCIMASFSMQWEQNRDFFWSMFVASGFYGEQELGEISKARSANGEAENAFLSRLKKMSARVGALDMVSMRVLQEGVLLGGLKAAHASYRRLSIWQHKGSTSLRDTSNFEGNLELMFPKPPFLSGTEREYLNRTFALARGKGIPVFLVKIPFARSVPLEKKLRYWQKYDDLLVSLDGPFRLVEPPAMADDLYLSAGHLNSKGTETILPVFKNALESCYR